MQETRKNHSPPTTVHKADPDPRPNPQTAASGPRARTGRFAGISPLNTPSTSKATHCSECGRQD